MKGSAHHRRRSRMQSWRSQMFCPSQALCCVGRVCFWRNILWRACWAERDCWAERACWADRSTLRSHREGLDALLHFSGAGVQPRREGSGKAPGQELVLYSPGGRSNEQGEASSPPPPTTPPTHPPTLGGSRPRVGSTLNSWPHTECSSIRGEGGGRHLTGCFSCWILVSPMCVPRSMAIYSASPQ